MSKAKKQLRTTIALKVRERENYHCKICNIYCELLEPHHITPRKVMVNGGTVLSNLIGLCPPCHEIVETTNTPNKDELYKLIGMSYNQAILDSFELGFDEAVKRQKL